MCSVATEILMGETIECVTQVCILLDVQGGGLYPFLLRKLSGPLGEVKVNLTVSAKWHSGAITIG